MSLEEFPLSQESLGYAEFCLSNAADVNFS
jgi:hypothetical protein